MKLKLYIFIMVVLFCSLLFLFKATRNTPPTEKTKTYLFMGVENRGKLIRGWNDLTMLVVEEKNRIKIISFPRDTLVYISPKGWWTMNALYLVLGAEGTVNWFNHNFKNLKIDGYMIYNLEGTDKLVSDLQKHKNVPKILKKFIDWYEYINDWVRHRKKLRFEIDRQRRIHAFLEYLSKELKKNRVPAAIVDLVSLLVDSNCEGKRNWNLKKLYKNILAKKVEFYLWEGTHKTVNFYLQHEFNRRVFQKGKKVVYNLKHKNLSYVTNQYKNPYEFDLVNFFKMKSKPLPIKIEPGVYKNCTIWNGGFTDDQAHLISDHDFTNQNYTKNQVFEFLKNFPKNKLTSEEKVYLIDRCRYYRVNIWVALTQMQKESSLIGNESSFSYEVRKGRAMGYDCGTVATNKKGHPVGKYHSYKKQVDLGLKCLRKWFDNYSPEKSVKVYSYEKEIKPKNAATYALYMYTPFYGEAYPHGDLSVGNRRFMSIWYSYRRKR